MEQHTQVEVVVLSITDEEDGRYGMDESCGREKISVELPYCASLTR